MKSKLKKSLSLLLALVMVMSCMSMSAFASETAGEPKYVAQVGEIMYTDIQDAIAAAMTSEDTTVNHTVKFLDDVEVDTWYQNVFATGYSYLAGHEGDKQYVGYHYREGFGNDAAVASKWPGELTIIGGEHTLKINDVYVVSGQRHIFDGFQKLNISNLTIESPHQNGISICMYSGVIDGVTFNINGRAAIYTSSGETDSDNNRIEIKNCTFNDYNSYAIYSAEDGSANGTIISNNTFNTGRAVQVRGDMQFVNNVVNCKDGITVAGNATNAVVRGNYFVAGKDRSMKLYQASNTKIEGNVILSKIELDSKVTAADLSGNYWTDGKAPANLPTSPVTPTYSSYYTVASNLPTATSVGANFTLSNLAKVGGESYVAQIGGTKYETLEKAFAAATEGQTITLLSDVALSDRLFVNAGATPAYAGSNNRYATTSENKAITLDLNGNDITSSSNIALAGGSLSVTGNGEIKTTTDGLAPIEVRGTGNLAAKRTLTIGAGVKLVGSDYGLNIFGSNDAQKNLIDVTIDGEVTGTVFVLGNLKNAENAINIVVNGTVAAVTDNTAEDPSVGIALNGNADVTVNEGATVSGESGIEVRAGSLIVEGGEITATAQTYGYKANGSGSTTKGAAVAVAQHGTLLPTSATINGGTLTGVKTIGVTNVNNDMSKVTVTAKETYTESTMIPEGYEWVDAEDAGYKTLAEADTFVGYTDAEILQNDNLVNADDGTVIELAPKAGADAEDDAAYAAEKVSESVVTKYEVKVAEITNTVNTTKTEAFVSSVKTASVIAKAKAAAKGIDAISINEGDTNTIELFVKADNQQPADTDTLSYTVDPYAIVNGNTDNPVKLENDDLTDNASFTFKLKAPAGATEVNVTHRWTEQIDGKTEETFKSLPVDSNGYVTVTLSHFSDVDVTKSADENTVYAEIWNFTGYFAERYEMTVRVKLYDAFDASQHSIRLTLEDGNGEGNNRVLTAAADETAYLKSNVVTYMSAPHTGTSGAKYMDFTVKLFGRYLDKDIIFEVVDKNENAKLINSFAYSVGDTVISSATPAYSVGYSLPDYLSLRASAFTAENEETKASVYSGLAAAVNGLASAVAGLD